MDIEVLGGFAARLGSTRIVPTAPKPRQVLALLALNAGQPVPAAVLVEELWGARPPRSARTTLQTYVLRLRELIDSALPGAAGAPRRTAKQVLVTLPGGYLLETGAGTLDFREFDRLSAEGYRAMEAGDHTGAARLLHAALALWTGPAFVDIQPGRHLEVQARRLEEARLCALDRRIEVDLLLGRHRELLPELTVLVERYHLHESLYRQFMLALYRAGRPGEALRVYQRLRGTLVRELGLEPSAPVQRLQQSILKASLEVSQEFQREAHKAPAEVG
ncbi:MULTISPECIES: AfsR/SARP family transcriptional regulator [Streptomyces]|uniref:AfsR/SARP family transcriptional regulator n=1 Tax=Streptomyces TaxID=1883 RepID=UPI0007C7C2BC|nr:AfsR/SARP family transcriptional regulator [Streptomyces durhamensis]